MSAADLGTPSSPQPHEDPGEAAPSPGEAPPSPPHADLQVRLNDDPSLGFCVFAMRRFSSKEILFRESTALEATHDTHAGGNRDVHDRYLRMSDYRRRALHGAFPYLAWANSIDAQEAAEARTLIDSKVITKGFVLDNQLTAADHMRMRPDGSDGPPPPKTPVSKRTLTALRKGLRKRGSEADDEDAAAERAEQAERDRREWARRETTAWFHRYAFRLQPVHAFTNARGNYQAAVYLLTDLINHRCAGFNNCRVATDVGGATVMAVRDIEPGEEVTINYNKDIKDFKCKGECCVKKK